MAPSHTHILRIEGLRALKYSIEVFGHAFACATQDTSVLYGAPGSGMMTEIELRNTRSDFLKESSKGPLIAIGALQLAYLFFERVTSGEPILTIRDLKAAEKTDRGFEIRDIFAGGNVVTIIVTQEYDQLQALDAEGEPVNQPSVT